MADFSVKKVEPLDTADDKKASDMNPKSESTAIDNYKDITSTALPPYSPTSGQDLLIRTRQTFSSD
jgi:hypothetical protein